MSQASMGAESPASSENSWISGRVEILRTTVWAASFFPGPAEPPPRSPAPCPTPVGQRLAIPGPGPCLLPSRPGSGVTGPGGQEVRAGFGCNLLDCWDTIVIRRAHGDEKPQGNRAIIATERVSERGVAESAEITPLVPVHEYEGRLLGFNQVEKVSSRHPQLLEGRAHGVTSALITPDVAVEDQLQYPRGRGHVEQRPGDGTGGRGGLSGEPPAPTRCLPLLLVGLRPHPPRTQEAMTALCLMSQACRSYPVQQALMDSAIASLPPRRDIDAYTHPPPPRTKPKSSGNKKIKEPFKIELFRIWSELQIARRKMKLETPTNPMFVSGNLLELMLPLRKPSWGLLEFS